MANDGIISGRIDVDTQAANTKLTNFQNNLDKTFEKYRDTVQKIKDFGLKLPGNRNLDLSITGLDSVQQYLDKIKELNATAPSTTRFANSIQKLSDLSKALKSDNIQKFGDIIVSFAVDVIDFTDAVNKSTAAMIQFNNLAKQVRIQTSQAAVGVRDLARSMAVFNLVKNGKIDFKFDPDSMKAAEGQIGGFVNKMIRQVELLESASAAVGKELSKGALIKFAEQGKQANTVLDQVAKGTRIASQDTRNFAIDIRAVNTVLGVIGYSAFANQIKSIAKSMIDATAKTEEYRASLLAVTKDQVRTNELFQQFQQYSIKTPFELPEVMEAGIKLEAVTKKLKGFNMTTEDALELAGDLSMTFGKDLRTGVDTVAKALGGSAESVEMLRNNFGVTRPDLERFGVAITNQGGVLLRTQNEIHNYIRAVKEIQKEVSGMNALDFRQGNLATSIAAIGDNLFKLYNELGKSILPAIKAFANGIGNLLQSLQELPGFLKAAIAITVLFSAGIFLFAEKLAGLAIIIGTVMALTEKKAEADLAAAAAARVNAIAQGQLAATYGSLAVSGIGAGAIGSVAGMGQAGSAFATTASKSAGLFPTFSAGGGAIAAGVGAMGSVLAQLIAYLSTPVSGLIGGISTLTGAAGAATEVFVGITVAGMGLIVWAGALAVAFAALVGIMEYLNGKLHFGHNEGADEYYATREQRGGLYKTRQSIEQANVALTPTNRSDKEMSELALRKRLKEMDSYEKSLSTDEDHLSATNKEELKRVRAGLQTTRGNLSIVTGRTTPETASQTETYFREAIKGIDRNVDIAKLGGKDEFTELQKQIPILKQIVEETSKDSTLVEVNLEARKKLQQILEESVNLMKMHVDLGVQAQKTGVYWMSVQQKANLLQQEINAMVGTTEKDQLERAKKLLELKHMTTVELQQQNNEYNKLAREGLRASQEFVSIEDKIADKRAEIADKMKLAGYGPKADKTISILTPDDTPGARFAHQPRNADGSKAAVNLVRRDMVFKGSPGSPEYKADKNAMTEFDKEKKIIERERLMKEYEYTKSEWQFKINQANLASIELGKLIKEHHKREMILLEEKKKIYREYYKYLMESAREYTTAVIAYNDQTLSNRTGNLDIREKYGYHTEKDRIKIANDAFKNKSDQIMSEGNAKIAGYRFEADKPTTDKQRVAVLEKLISLEREAMALRIRGAEIDKDKLTQENSMKENQRLRDERQGDLELARDRIKYKQDTVLNSIKEGTAGTGSNDDLTFTLQKTMADTYKAETELLDLKKQQALETLKDNDLKKELLRIQFEQVKLGQDQLKTWTDINAEIRKQKKDKEDAKKKAFAAGGEFTMGGTYGSYEDMMKGDAEKEKARLDAKAKADDDAEETKAKLRDQFIGERLFGIKKINPRDKILDQGAELKNNLPRMNNSQRIEDQDFLTMPPGIIGINGRMIDGPDTQNSILKRAEKDKGEMKPVEATVDVVIHLEGKEIKRQMVNLTGLDKARSNPFNYDKKPSSL